MPVSPALARVAGLSFIRIPRIPSPACLSADHVFRFGKLPLRRFAFELARAERQAHDDPVLQGRRSLL